MAIIRIDVADAISENPIALQQVVDQIIDQLDDLSTGGTGGGGGGGDGDVYTLTATDGDGQVSVNLEAQTGADSAVIMRAGNGITINESGGTITFNASDGPDDGNYVTVNTATGEIQAGNSTFQYLYRYLHIGFASDINGTDFSTDPRDIPIGVNTSFFIGVFNSSSITPPILASSYAYRRFDWTVDHNVFLRTVGGHQIEFLTSVQAIIPDASAYDPSMTPLDFDILQINNGNIVDGAVSVEKLSIDQLSAITADVGDLTAGVIRGGNFTSADPANNAPDAFGSYLGLTNGDVLIGDSQSYFQFDADDDEIRLVSDLSTSSEINWVPNDDSANQRLMVNSNTFSNESANRNSHYAADGLASTRDGNFWVGHIETPINDSTRAGDPYNSTGIEISTLTNPNSGFTSTIMSNFGSVFFQGGNSDDPKPLFWTGDSGQLLPLGDANIQATRYANRGLSNDGNSVILGTDGAQRITANYPGGEILDFTQFSTGKQGSTSGQAIISNTQNLDLPAGTYAISIEELAATRRQVIYDLSGMVGQVSDEAFNDVFDASTQFVFDGALVGNSTVITDAATSNGIAFFRMRFPTTEIATVANYLYLLTGEDEFNSVEATTPAREIAVDSSRKLNLLVTNSNGISATVNGVRRVDIALGPIDADPDAEEVQLIFWMHNPSDSNDNADSFLVNVPNGFSNNSDLTYTVDYDRGAPSGLLLTAEANLGNPGYIPIRFNENITTNDELLSRFETEFERITSLTNNDNGQQQPPNYTGQEVRFDTANVQVIVTNNGEAFTDISTFNAGTDGNFAAVAEDFPSSVIRAHKFGIEPNTSNSVYGGWIQGNRYDTGGGGAGDERNVGVNGIFDQSSGNFDVYGSKQFTAIPNNNSVNIGFDIIPTNDSNTEFVRSNYVLSDTSAQPQSGLMIVSSVGPMTLTGEFYGTPGGSNQNNQLLDGAGIVMQYKEIQS